MKKLSILIIVMTISLGANAQKWDVGGAGGIRCVTKGNVGIESLSDPLTDPVIDPVKDARLRIYGGTTGIPEIKISRPASSTSTPNFFEIWKMPQKLIDVINSNGWLGILTPTPAFPLDVNGDAIVRGNATVNETLTVGQSAEIGTTLTVDGSLINLNNSNPGTYSNINGNTTDGVLSMSANTGSNDGPNIELYGGLTWTADPTRVGAIHYNSYGSANNAHLFYNYDPSTGLYLPIMSLGSNGKVLIGAGLVNGTTPAPDGYLLYVQTGILTEKLKVANSTDGANWSDFVFNKDYELMSLGKVESYVKTNKHLPEIPSAADVAKDGIDVASMDAKLLQKIEELTLYVIQQQKEIDELKKQIKN